MVPVRENGFPTLARATQFGSCQKLLSEFNAAFVTKEFFVAGLKKSTGKIVRLHNTLKSVQKWLLRQMSNTRQIGPILRPVGHRLIAFRSLMQMHYARSSAMIVQGNHGGLFLNKVAGFWEFANNSQPPARRAAAEVGTPRIVQVCLDKISDNPRK